MGLFHISYSRALICVFEHNKDSTDRKDRRETLFFHWTRHVAYRYCNKLELKFGESSAALGYSTLESTDEA